ncbi:hypothetical protein GLAREA_13028 [Glarea lozoyensis ATCC 20868]|uniref:Heterokaryon incompatibility domain-containing protein n=1 Tax=Glarea lozoyensis (strain ATCC 20868 / MF5171) TaxID=1116229 RepID=S3CXJ4_GLAL2|nr:uncharacterized protein GLAREA_13028 [Glarea lozoyensis ATCC 20868]EPE30305.1 hypothetical protein GLAREA_13028 [Glarea lozoyensis ATCC 20868]
MNKKGEVDLGMFEYEPLEDSNSFRLLLLSPGTGDAPLDCTLVEDSRGGNTFSYEALSYTWGNSIASHHITLNGDLFLITPNLYLALRHLRRADVERILWIDAICINQSSPLEKTQQVSIMRNIYQTAVRVVVWLGEDCTEACHTISWVSSHQEGGEKDRKHLVKTARTIMDGCPEPLVDFDSDGMNSREDIAQSRRVQLLKGFNDLLSRTWWSRVWTLQEVVLNPDVTIMCGYSEVPWNTFMAFVEGIQRSKPILQVSPDESTGYQQSLQRSFSRQQFARSSSQKMSDLLLQHRGLKASDPRDNVYALLGLASDMSKSKFLPDYSKSISEVYKRLTREIVVKRKNLAIICASQPSATSRSGLPSWAPDWSSPWIYFCLARAPHNALNTSTPDVKFSKDLSRLKAGGTYLATIESVSTTYDASEPTLIEWLKRVRNWDTLIAEWHSDSQPFSFDCFRQIYSQHVLGSETAYPVDLFAQTPKQAKKSSKKDVMKFRTHMNMMCLNRKLATMRQSWQYETRIEGLVPCNALPGDRIVVLHGCNVPVVLRKGAAEDWSFVGDAYVDGYMYGRAFGAFSSVEDVFSIR